MPPKNDKPGGGGNGNGNGGPKRDKTPPSLEGPTTISVEENQTDVADFDTDDGTAAWSVAGLDAALLDIGADGVITFRTAPDYEAPQDADGDGVYEVTVQITDPAGNSTSQALAVTVLDVVEDTTPPTIEGVTAITVDENQTAVSDFQADEAGTWTLVGADDDALFVIDPVTGTVSFGSSPDYEVPGDANQDNVYRITVAITDAAGNTATQTIDITVADVDEDAGAPYNRIVIFGDSLSDNGNFNALAAEFLLRDDNGEPIYSVPFQYDGGGSVRTYDTRAFTDGTVYADTLARLLSLDANYENYAFGGAQALGSRFGAGYIQDYSNLSYATYEGGTAPFSIVEDTDAALAAYGEFDINLAAQVDRYLADTSGIVEPGTLAILNIGANDLGEFDTSLLNILLGGVDEFARDIGNEIETQVLRLLGAGVDTIALYRLPVAEFFVGFDDLAFYEEPVARDLIDAVNNEIDDAERSLLVAGVDVQLVRLDTMSKELMVDMATYGFLARGPYLYGYSGDPRWVETSPGVIEPVFEVNASAAQYRPEQILFFDEIHPSGAMHDMLAVFSNLTVARDETLGSTSANVFDLTGADDFVIARDGADVANLGAGNDVALGGTGNDSLRGDEGSDLLIGGKGGDNLQGGDGSDFLTGSSGNDTLAGGADPDILIGDLGNDTAYGNRGDDIFIYFEEELRGGSGAATDFYQGGAGEDTLLVFLSEMAGVVQTASTNSVELSFEDGSTLTTVGIENIILHNGLPEDLDSPINDLSLAEDLWARYDDGQLWGVI
ncbi:SGNH/GDSL hydrolase family protein [Aestuariicoccus sp. MJ-SS9]|uniref:SGNH/GDSL hydrolase family protein n=1 Tax=Aestuariicoccus sp. MJ-SS9 TaxID=3079855 RepID=UPI00290E3983|nr:SGNH/GDSL hydrolase family protein [Aestuariicoccus sp. MJ-SS9]MDU8910996.1 SGNH/GDSL hydrolase family protein [Aestuariicoccus sp. MJ-SS9]